MFFKKCCSLCGLAIALVLVGALNWGLVGVGMLLNADWNLVYMLLGRWPMVEAIVYVLVGVAALYKIFLYPKCCGKCNCGSGACAKCGSANCNGSCGNKMM